MPMKALESPTGRRRRPVRRGPEGPSAWSVTTSRDQNGQDWADIIDFLTMYPQARRRVARLLGEIEASTQ